MGTTISAVAANGNRSYNLTSSADMTTVLSPGMRLRTTRTVAAPQTSFSLDGTNDYYVKTTPAGMTFTDDFVVSMWVYPTAYTTSILASRSNGTNGWDLYMNSDGTMNLVGYNGAVANNRRVYSYQSLPLNRWTHIALQLDMSTYTATTTTCYVMFDGKDVPAALGQSGTNPTALIQAGNLEIGSRNGGLLPFSGYIDQVAIYNAKVTQATITASMNQTLTGSETNLISAYKNGSVTDLNVTNANNLTATNGATTAAVSPFGNNASSSTLDYAIVQKVTASTITVQVAEGCTIPTTGGVSAVSYSTQKTPFGFPSDYGKFRIECIYKSDLTTGAESATVWATITGANFSIPTGAWKWGFKGTTAQQTTGASSTRSGWVNLSSTVPTNAVTNYPVMSRMLSFSGTAAQANANAYDFVTLASPTTYTFYGLSDTVTATETTVLRGVQGAVVAYAENTYL